MLDNARSHGLWELTAPPAPETAGLLGSIEVDTAIVGGGYTGLSAALHLAEAGANVALLEAVEIGFGGAGRNVGLVNAGMWVMPDVLPDLLGGDYGERLLGLLGDAPKLVFDLIERHRIECEVERAGTLHCAVGPKGLKELEAARSSMEPPRRAGGVVERRRHRSENWLVGLRRIVVGSARGHDPAPGLCAGPCTQRSQCRRADIHA